LSLKEICKGNTCKQPKRLCSADHVRPAQCTPPHDEVGSKVDDFLPTGQGSDILVKLIKDSKALLEAHEINKRRSGEGKNMANMIWHWQCPNEIAGAQGWNLCFWTRALMQIERPGCCSGCTGKPAVLHVRLEIERPIPRASARRLVCRYPIFYNRTNELPPSKSNRREDLPN